MDDKKILEKFLEFKLKNSKNTCCKICNEKIDIKSVNPKYHRIHLKCGHYINPLKGTPFFTTRVPLKNVWNFLKAFYYDPLKGRQAGRILAVSISGGWKVLQKTRSKLEFTNQIIGDKIWIDELFLGSPAKNRHKQKMSKEEIIEYNKAKKTDLKGEINSRKRTDSYKFKKVVFGIAFGSCNYKLFDSGIRCKDMAELKSIHRKKWMNTWTETLSNYQGKIKTIVHDGDFALSKIIKDLNFNDELVKHSKDEYVKVKDGKIVTTNSIEGSFGRFKRAFKGEQTWASDKHIQLYLNEYNFRASIKNISFEDFCSDYIFK